VAEQPAEQPAEQSFEPPIARAIVWLSELDDFGGDLSTPIIVDALANRFRIRALEGYVERVEDVVGPSHTVAPFLRLVGVGYAPPLTDSPFGVDMLRAITCVSRGSSYEPSFPDGEGYVLTHQALAIIVATDLECGPTQRMEDLHAAARERLTELTDAHAITTPLGLEAWAVLLGLDASVLPAETRLELIAAQQSDGSWGDDYNRVHETALAIWVLLETSGREPVAALGARAR
jgi:hypothetical protein